MSANVPQIILVADDDPSVGALLKITLERAGYRVIPAFDGEDALAKAKSARPDLIVLDVMMPGVDGYHVARDLANEHDLPSPKIIILTSRTEERDRQISEQLGADAFITKPFEPDDLVKTVQRLLGPT